MLQAQVLVDGKPLDVRTDKGDTWVAIPKGVQYEIDVASPYSMPVKAVVSVDGVNVLDGSEVSDPKLAQGIVLRPGTAWRVPGYRVGEEDWARFKTSLPKDAYANSREAGSDSKIGQIEINYVPGHIATPTPTVRGNVPVDVGTAFGGFTRSAPPSPEEGFFPTDAKLPSVTIFYGSPEGLDAAGIKLPARPERKFCPPPPGWKKGEDGQDLKKKNKE